MQSNYCITFGQRYRREEHPINPRINPDCYVTIQAANTEDAVMKAFELFNAYWSDVKPVTNFDPTFYPAGELKL